MMMGFGMGLGLLFLLGFGILVVLGVVWLARSSSVGGQPPSATRPDEATPREILDQRYARGEITRDQYEQLRSDLDV